jgi:uncharacterized protein YndB with AHSA1/START domain
MTDELNALSFTVSAHVSRPVAEVYEAVADPDQLSRYFTTGGARGRMESGGEVSWDFDDFPGRFPVSVVEAEAPRRIVIRWDARGGVEDHTTTTFEFEPVDEGARTLVTITEAAWRATPEGAENAFRNCAGWTEMLNALKVWVEHGLNIRAGYFV